MRRPLKGVKLPFMVVALWLSFILSTEMARHAAVSAGTTMRLSIRSSRTDFRFIGF